MAPRGIDIEVWVGNTYRQRFRFGSGGEPFDLTGSKLVFKATYPNGGGAIRKATDVENSGLRIVVDPSADPPIDETSGIFELFFSVTETRAMPEGAPAYRYEIERWMGEEGEEQISYQYGGIKVTKWVNDDVDP